MSESSMGTGNWAESAGELAQAWNLDALPGHGRRPASLKRTVAQPRPGDPPRSDVVIDFSFRIDESPIEPGSADLRRAAGEVRFPVPGEALGPFKIVGELGRGAFGRVYLAEQAELADRLVALKVAVSLGNEPRNLARLQHAHIVPIHSVHDDPRTGLRLICMPYVGGANLAAVLQTAGARVVSQATGRSLVEALDRVGHSAAASAQGATGSRPAMIAGSRDVLTGLEPPAHPVCGGHAATRGVASPTMVRSLWARYLARLPRWSRLEGGADEPAEPCAAAAEPDGSYEPARRYLRSATYVQASIWIAARLAEALEHAHDRGILHRDIKPSNILIAADGTPMLLDFNLATDIRPEQLGGDSRGALGGTLPYMAPEHLDAFNPLGNTPPGAVGPSADLYALGLILFEMVAGRHPFGDPPSCPRITDTLRLMVEERRRAVPSARAVNPLVPWGLESVLRRCLEPDPSRRYARAGELADDLRRLLDDCPLRHAPELSTRERLAKWMRRHPLAASSTTIGGAAFAAVVACGGIAWTLADHLEASRARLHYNAFTRDFQEALFLLNTSTGPIEHLGQGIARADKALGSYGVGGPGDWTLGPDVRRLPAGQQARLREEVSELVQLRARATVVRARQGIPDAARRRILDEAVRWLDRAERFDPHPSYALFHDRALYLAALGRDGRAAADRASAQAHPPITSRDFAVLGTALLAEGQKERAEQALSRAVALDPGRFWSWFALGLCHDQQGRHHEAAADFAVCAVIAPGFAWPNVNRGLALTAAGRLTEARAAYDRALRDDPDLLAARVNRALCCLEQGDNLTALADLDRALALGHHEAPTLAARAEALARLGRRAEALRDFAAALRERPGDPILLVARGTFRLATDPDGARDDFRRVLATDASNLRAHLGMAHLLRRSDPHAALGHLDAALASAPDFGDALQLRALIRGRLGRPAAEADADQLERTPTVHRLYNASCAMALLFRSSGQDRHAARAMALLERAIAAGFPAQTAGADPDLDALRGRPEFGRVVGEPSLRAQADPSTGAGR
jgi:serine/threonine protein kinase/Tfp pilus assembly protein PilF